MKKPAARRDPSAGPAESPTDRRSPRSITIPLQADGTIDLSNLTPPARGKVKRAFAKLTMPPAAGQAEAPQAARPASSSSGSSSSSASSSSGADSSGPAAAPGVVPDVITGWVMLGIGFLGAQLAQRLLNVTPAESHKAYFSADQARELGPEIQKALNRNLGAYFTADGMMSDDVLVILAVGGALGSNLMTMQRPQADTIDTTTVPDPQPQPQPQQPDPRRPPYAPPPPRPGVNSGPPEYGADPADQPFEPDPTEH